MELPYDLYARLEASGFSKKPCGAPRSMIAAGCGRSPATIGGYLSHLVLVLQTHRALMQGARNAPVSQPAGSPCCTKRCWRPAVQHVRRRRGGGGAVCRAGPGQPQPPQVYVAAPPAQPALPLRAPSTSHLVMGGVIFFQVRAAGSNAAASAPLIAWVQAGGRRPVDPGCTSGAPTCQARHAVQSAPPCSQALALAGATFTGILARKRRQEMEALNAKLRQINAELRLQREEEVGDWVPWERSNFSK